MALAESPIDHSSLQLHSPSITIAATAAANQPIGTHNNRFNDANQQLNQYDLWYDRSIVTQKIRLVEFSAFIEYNSTSRPQFNSLHQQDPQMLQDLIPNQHALVSNGNLHPHNYQQQPLASNHHLTSHFNYAGSNQTNSYSPTALAHPEPKPPLSVVPRTSGPSQLLNHQVQQQPSHNHLQQLASAGPIRHSYIKINYKQHPTRLVNKLERIDINQIQDKFPEVSGLDSLYQRGPSDAFFLVKFWADLNYDYEYNINDQNAFFGFSSHFETIDSYRAITCSTKACSYGLQVVEKVEKIYGCFNNSNGRYSYVMNRSPMCEFMINFIRKLRQLPQTSHMNSVLENLTILQVITSESSSEILLCLAYVFEVATDGQVAGPKYNVYKLTKS